MQTIIDLPDRRRVVLIALIVDDHVRHEAAEAWFAGGTEPIESADVPPTRGRQAGAP